MSELLNPEPLDDALIEGLMTKKPRLHWYEIRAYLKWRRALRKWRKRSVA